nr:MAG TPA: hypothetical protein [Caudoviricetes sp.]
MLVTPSKDAPRYLLHTRRETSAHGKRNGKQDQTNKYITPWQR